ncbi:MAG: exosortase/archaeosortase family protein [Candidatus Nanohaloarchaea archaeon]|jgi:exosortase/archaeosortase family protein
MATKYVEEYLETERQHKLYHTMLFLFKLLAVGLVFQMVLVIYPDTTGIQEWFASLMGLILSPFIPIDVNGIYIHTLNSSYMIVQDCLGWKSMAIFTGLFLASTRKYIQQARYLLLGIVAIFVANIIRVASTIYLSEIGLISFDLIHTFLWRWGLTVIVFLIWLYWYAKILDSESKEINQSTDPQSSEIS